MAYGAQRFLYNNFLTDASMITVDTQEPGRVGGPFITQDGTANWFSGGSYIGAEDLLYTVQIDDVSAGKDIGNATFRWKTSDTVSGWEGSGIPTDTSPTTLGSTGVNFSWESVGSGNDFEVNDIATFWVYATFGASKLIDFDRDTFWQSEAAATELTFEIDLGSAQNVTALILADHNFTDSATIYIAGNTSASWGAPPYEVEPSVGTPIYEYINQTYRYWLVYVDDSTNTDGYLLLGQLYVGNYTALSSTAARSPWESDITIHKNEVSTRSDAGKVRQYFYSRAAQFGLKYTTLTETDMDALITMWKAHHNVSTGRSVPLWVHYFYDTADRLYFCRLMSDIDEVFFRYQLYQSTALQFEEVPYLRRGSGTVGNIRGGLYYDGYALYDGAFQYGGEK